MYGRSIELKGFSLLELLVVMVIMSLLFTLVPPLLSGALPSLTLKATTNDVLQDLKFIRNIAVLQGRKTQVIIDAGDRSYLSGERNHGKPQILPKDIDIEAKDTGLQDADTHNPVIAFFADGSSSGGVITLKNKDKAYSIIVDWITGGVTINDGEVRD